MCYVFITLSLSRPFVCGHLVTHKLIDLLTPKETVRSDSHPDSSEYLLPSQRNEHTEFIKLITAFLGECVRAVHVVVVCLCCDVVCCRM